MYPNQLDIPCHCIIRIPAFVFTQLIVLNAQMKLWNRYVIVFGWDGGRATLLNQPELFHIELRCMRIWYET